MRNIVIVLLLFMSILYLYHKAEENIVINALTFEDEPVSIIVKVEGDPEKHKQYVERYFPTVEVVSTYSLLFQGLALKIPPNQVNKIVKLQFIETVYPVQTYQTLMPAMENDMNGVLHKSNVDMEKNKNTRLSFRRARYEDSRIVLPENLNNTTYTGKGIDVAVIDTGIDYTHPDLETNFIRGKDVVDLDDDPMETKIIEGLSTNHGTHVAGIIGANGEIKGVAPDVNIYAYRALGPGGFGTTIQILAALEEAVKDKVDIINLSLGNSVNGPDYPTSLAVNAAAERGIAVVIANGNAGPDQWTVGSPATASQALAVGAYDQERYVPYLYDFKTDKKISVIPLSPLKEWNLQHDDDSVTHIKAEDIEGKIVLLPSNETIYKKIEKAKQHGAKAILVYETDQLPISSLIDIVNQFTDIPIALITEKDGKWLNKRIKKEDVYFKNELELKHESVAPFSSRGPVTVNWQLKPDVIAPGVNILSTVPEGYAVLNGTSMAAPHVAGAIAIIKEARPAWTNEQIFGALKTTAKKIKKGDKMVSPTIQGAGLIQIEEAIQAKTIVHNPLMSFGKMNDHITERTIDLTVENNSATEQHYSFKIPKAKKGMTWELPYQFTLKPHEIRAIPITLKVNSLQLKEGIYESSLTLTETTNDNSYTLPYVFINKTADYPHVMGFTFHLNPFDQEVYNYQIYVSEPIKSVQVQLYDYHTLTYEGILGEWTDLAVGMNEGEIKRRDIIKHGQFYGLILVQLENGDFVNYETGIYIPID